MVPHREQLLSTRCLPFLISIEGLGGSVVEVEIVVGDMEGIEGISRGRL